MNCIVHQLFMYGKNYLSLEGVKRYTLNMIMDVMTITHTLLI